MPVMALILSFAGAVANAWMSHRARWTAVIAAWSIPLVFAVGAASLVPEARLVAREPGFSPQRSRRTTEERGDDGLFSVRSAPTPMLSVFNPDGVGEVATQRLSLGAHHALQTETALAVPLLQSTGVRRIRTRPASAVCHVRTPVGRCFPGGSAFGLVRTASNKNTGGSSRNARRRLTNQGGFSPRLRATRIRRWFSDRGIVEKMGEDLRDGFFAGCWVPLV